MKNLHKYFLCLFVAAQGSICFGANREDIWDQTLLQLGFLSQNCRRESVVVVDHNVSVDRNNGTRQYPSFVFLVDPDMPLRSAAEQLPGQNICNMEPSEALRQLTPLLKRISKYSRSAR